MHAAPPAALPLIALAGVWLWNLAEDGAVAARCVDGCLTLRYASAEYGLDSRVKAVEPAAPEGTEPIADTRGFRFKDPATGSEIWPADVPSASALSSGGHTRLH
ncbi:hypothetical protein ACWEPC_29095 [Nonomuraea sp. NPDC004297]